MTWILNNSRKTPPLSQSDFTKELLAKNGMKLNGLGYNYFKTNEMEILVEFNTYSQLKSLKKIRIYVPGQGVYFKNC